MTSSAEPTYSGNILYCLNSDQRCVEQGHIWPSAFDSGEYPLVDFGSFNNNYYFNPFNDVPIEIGTAYGERVTIPRALSEWQAEHGQDLNSHVSPLDLKDYLVTGSTLTSIAVNGYFNNGVTDLANWDWPTCLSLAACGELQLVQMGGSNALNSQDCRNIEQACDYQAIQTSDAGEYLLRFKMKSDEAGSMRSTLRYSSSTGYDRGRFFGVSTQPTDYELRFTVQESGDDYMYPIFMDEQYEGDAHDASNVTIDNVEVYTCTLAANYEQTIAQEHRLFYNNPLGADNDQNVFAEGGIVTVPTLTADPDACWSDVHGNFYASGDDESITLAEWESIVLFKFNVPNSSLVFVDDVYTVPASPEPEIWTDNQNITGSVVVPDGATLIIDGAHIGFAASTPEVTSNIVVEPGGILTLRNGAVLTNWQGCTAPAEMWDGVQVRSYFDPEDPVPQSYPGQVIMENGSQISNALTGILAGDGDPADPGSTNTTPNVYGGVVNTNGGIFRNNRFDVVQKQWVSPIGARSPLEHEEACEARVRFINTRFITDAPLNDPLLTPVAHLRLANVEVGVHGCTFANELPEHASSLEMGHGIEGFNAKLDIGPCVTANCLTGSDRPNTFSNLDHAVHATASQGAPFVSVHDNTFADNICGVFLSNLPGFSVVWNTIEMGRWNLGSENYTQIDEEHWQGRHRGIFTTGGFGFSIQDNTLLLSVPAEEAAPTEGIVVGYTRAHDDIVFHNNASGLERAYVGEGICADVGGGPSEVNNTGLQFHCNENHGNATNFLARIAEGDEFNAQLHTIRGHQGSDVLAAGNTFDQTDDPRQFELATSNTTVEEVLYYYAATTEETPNPVWLYTTVTDGQEMVPVELGNGVDNACTTPGPGVIGGSEDLGTLPGIVQANNEAFVDLQLYYDQLLDGGATQALLDSLVGQWYTNYNQAATLLDAISPFMSAEVLEAVVLYSGFSQEEIVAVLIANPEGMRHDDLLELLENENFEPELIDLVVASWEQETYRSVLEKQMAGYTAQVVQAANHWLYLLQTDTVPTHPDTLRMVWQQVHTPAARYAEAALLIGLGDYVQADSVIANMPLRKHPSEEEVGERDRMLDYIDVLATAAADDRNAYQLDGSEVRALEHLVGDAYDRPAVWASNLLCSAYQLCRAPYTGGGGGKSKAQRVITRPAVHARRPTALHLQPNPARDQVSIAYLLPGNTAAARLVVRDIQGRTVQEFTVGGEQGQVQWAVQRAMAGVYSVTLVHDGKTISTERLIVQP